jgi:hypothetical protein
LFRAAKKTILNPVNIKNYKLLHYVLILLLMLAPLRSVFAMQFVACDMKSMPSPAVTDSVMTAGHSRHALADVSIGDSASKKSVNSINRASHQVEQAVNQQATLQADLHVSKQSKDCCGNSNTCLSDCHFAISVSMFLQTVDYSPLLLNADIFENVSITPLVRELSPPSKPPLHLYS